MLRFTVEKWIDEYLLSLLAYRESILSKHPSPVCNCDAVVGPNERQASHSVNQAGTRQRTPRLSIWTNELNFMAFVVQRVDFDEMPTDDAARIQPPANPWHIKLKCPKNVETRRRKLWSVFDSVSRSKLKFNVKWAAMRPRNDRLSSHAANNSTMSQFDAASHRHAKGTRPNGNFVIVRCSLHCH